MRSVSRILLVLPLVGAAVAADISQDTSPYFPAYDVFNPMQPNHNVLEARAGNCPTNYNSCGNLNAIYASYCCAINTNCAVDAK